MPRERTERRWTVWYDPTQPPIVNINTRKYGKRVEIEIVNRFESTLSIWLDAHTVITRTRKRYCTFYSIGYFWDGRAYSISGQMYLVDLLEGWQESIIDKWRHLWTSRNVPYELGEDRMEYLSLTDFQAGVLKQIDEGCVELGRDAITGEYQDRLWRTHKSLLFRDLAKFEDGVIKITQKGIEALQKRGIYDSKRDEVYG